VMIVRTSFPTLGLVLVGVDGNDPGGGTPPPTSRWSLERNACRKRKDQQTPVRKVQAAPKYQEEKSQQYQNTSTKR
jgi:hypothetical protein